MSGTNHVTPRRLLGEDLKLVPVQCSECNHAKSGDSDKAKGVAVVRISFKLAKHLVYPLPSGSSCFMRTATVSSLLGMLSLPRQVLTWGSCQYNILSFLLSGTPALPIPRRHPGSRCGPGPHRQILVASYPVSQMTPPANSPCQEPVSKRKTVASAASAARIRQH